MFTGNAFVYVFKTSQLAVMAFITITVFLRTKIDPDSTGESIYMGVVFLSLITYIFNGFAHLNAERCP